MAYNPKKIAGGVAGGAPADIRAVERYRRYGRTTADLPTRTDRHDACRGGNVVTAQWFNPATCPPSPWPTPEGVHLQPGRRHTTTSAVQRVRNSADQRVMLEACHRADRRGGRRGNFYVNVGGNIKKNFTIDVRDLAEDANQGDDDGVLVLPDRPLRPGGRHGRAVGRGGDGRPGRRREHHLPPTAPTASASRCPALRAGRTRFWRTE